MRSGSCLLASMVVGLLVAYGPAGTVRPDLAPVATAVAQHIRPASPVSGPVGTAPVSIQPLPSARLTTTPAPLPGAGGLTVAQIESDANFILQAQLPDGAIAVYTDKTRISPYLANMAAEGLARAAVATGDTAYAEAAWRELDWYSSHETASGYVTDYAVADGQPVSVGTEDSTDAYAGTFLLAAATVWASDPVRSQLAAIRTGISGAVAAIESTQDGDGLTWAKPSWHVKYLMDEAEAYAGLSSAAGLASDLAEPALTARMVADAARIRSGATLLWNQATGSYGWAVYSDGVVQTTNWSNLYPDSLEEAWAVAYGLARASTATVIVGHLQQAEPQWDRPAATSVMSGASGPTGYWPVAGFALLAVGARSQAATAASTIQAGLDTAGRAWPFTPADAGNLIVLATGGPQK